MGSISNTKPLFLSEEEKLTFQTLLLKVHTFTLYLYCVIIGKGPRMDGQTDNLQFYSPFNNILVI